MRHLSMLALSLCFLAACGDKKKPADQPEEDEAEELACESNSDCEQGWVCLAGECASAASGAIYTDPESAVTPDKVRSHVDSINKKSEQRADEMLGDL